MEIWRTINVPGEKLTSLPAFSFCSTFRSVCEKTWKPERVAPCLGSGVLTIECGEQDSGALGGPSPSAVIGRWLFEEKLKVWVSAWATSNFCCPQANATRDCMAWLKVSWCWTSWRTHFERPEIKHTFISDELPNDLTVDNYCHLVLTLADKKVPVIYLLGLFL